MATHHYPVSLSWDGSTLDYRSYDRTHRVSSGQVQLELSADPAFRGNPASWNPELLLVAAASSCQLLSFLSAASRAGVEVTSYRDDAEGFMPEDQQPVRINRILLRPHITIRTGDPERVAELVEQAHQHCYIANTLTCPVDIEPHIEQA